MDEGDIPELAAGGEGEQLVVRPAVMPRKQLEHARARAYFFSRCPRWHYVAIEGSKISISRLRTAWTLSSRR